MNWFSRLATRRRLHEDLASSGHLDEKIDELVDSGMSREQAALAARRPLAT
jgi:hypothetical protein